METLLPNDPKYPNHLRFDLTAADIESLSKRLVAASKKTLDEVAAGKPTWEAMNKLADEDALFAVVSSSCTFPSYVSSDKSVRDAATAANQAIEAYQIEKSFRDDIYQLVKAYASTHDRSKHSPEENRYVDKCMEFFERNGLGLEKSKRERLQEVKKEISELCIKFQQNLNEDTTSLTFTKEELDGMSDDFLSSLSKEGDKYKVTLQYPHLFPVLKMAKSPETRRKMDLAKECQCREQNEPILERVVLLRQEEAKLLGFKNHAEYVLDIRMAKTPAKVMSFLNDLNEKMTPGFKSDLNEFLALKKAEMEKLGKPFDGVIHSYDYRYFYNQVLETKYQLNQEEIQQYFPLDHVTNEMLKVYQEVLGLVFKPTENPHVWHEEVKQYSVFDAESNRFMGHFYLDLHPREGKYGHAAEFDIQKSCMVNGKRQSSAAAMVANFTKSVGEKPSVLKHDEVVTYFHEFGHVMHELCTTANYYIFAGTNVQRDFVETPSQMLENWCYEKDILQRLSKHYKTGEALPENLRQQLVAAKKACGGVLYKRQLFFGLFDMTLHTAEGPVKTAEIWAKLRKEVAGIEAPPNSNGSANFGHLLGGYSAGYYGYLWSEVFSCDLFKVFQQTGVLDKATGKRYRNIILAQGGTRDAGDLLRDFLGREPNQEAFLVHAGLL